MPRPQSIFRVVWSWPDGTTHSRTYESLKAANRRKRPPSPYCWHSGPYTREVQQYDFGGIVAAPVA